MGAFPKKGYTYWDFESASGATRNIQHPYPRNVPCMLSECTPGTCQSHCRLSARRYFEILSVEIGLLPPQNAAMGGALEYRESGPAKLENRKPSTVL
eukprot:4414513-Prymnesium_polylepis.1